MSTATLAYTVVPPADLRSAINALREGSDEAPEAGRCAHALIDSVTAIMIATEARRRWLSNAKPHPDEALRMIDLICTERQRAVAAASRLRALVTAGASRLHAQLAATGS